MELATEGTPLEGSTLVVNMLPVIVHCDRLRRGCRVREPAELSLPALRRAGADLRQGRELEIESIEIEDARRRRSRSAMTTRIVELRQGILKKNDELAAGLRARFTAAGVLVLNLVSSPGTGKTAFLERTLRELQARGARAAALVGDLETDNDARRLAASGAPVRQINTHGICHLDAEMIAKAPGRLGGRGARRLDYLFIENVGNLVCPSSYDLGEKIRVALLSVTEGEDKPLKYPDAVQLRRRGGDYQDRSCRALRLRPRVWRSTISTRSGPAFASSRPPPKPARGWTSGLGIWRNRRDPPEPTAARSGPFRDILPSIAVACGWPVAVPFS